MIASHASKRLPHAVLDLPSRHLKAIKIERLLNLSAKFQPIRLLEIGTGSGGIAHYFATHPTTPYRVTAVDTVDQRLVRDGFDFQQVSDTTLPFPEDRFDVVLTNHVIEHVGDYAAQRAHLSEVHRVMKPRAIAYLAVPNRWMLVEPHYRLAFLSWLPRPLRSPYLRLMRHGAHYDCNPLTVSVLERLLQETGFSYRNLGGKALRETLAIEGDKGIIPHIAASLPDRLLERFAPLIPTLIYRLERKR